MISVRPDFMFHSFIHSNITVSVKGHDCIWRNVFDKTSSERGDGDELDVSF